ncbi:Procollagen galactosyltransferase 1 (Collagen beta(1-O)galactosyltransferase 1) (Glycosyltransferase 25 family member 1) (Hydroxylysine galactosyltransferase 1) [Durusdinium trenchii]|uniref:Procollagen galactosyltransferase 1 (Collagen beta(1-O)galactosyltransferase 1) (Glycosyltransferase 25 family member 1) (Hydroxylysine galactosyltransferase 1) n=1 Tax=Durusdinium trenchii TaxID=1381693 RepID=A0ABP0PR48_9DINO
MPIQRAPGKEHKRACDAEADRGRLKKALYDKEQQSTALQKSLVLAKDPDVRVRNQMRPGTWPFLALAFAALASLRWRAFCGGGPSAARAPIPRHAVEMSDNLLGLDEETVALHKKYHEATITYTAMNIDWAQDKGYENDGHLSAEEQAAIASAARARLFRWPELDAQDLHEVSFGPERRRFCSSADSPEALGDPGQNVFVISQMRRPSRLRHALHELYREGISAKIVDAVDGDGFRFQDEMERLGILPVPGYDGHKNHGIHLTTGEVGCFMSHFTIWHHMVKHQIPAALILEDDFDLQPDFATKLGEYLEEARGYDWNLMYVGRSPTEADWTRLSAHVVEPGYTLWTVGYILRLEGAKALLDAQVERAFLPLDDFFSVAAGRGMDCFYNDKVLEWKPHVPVLLRPFALTPPLVMPYVGSMFLSDTAKVRNATRYVQDLPP